MPLFGNAGGNGLFFDNAVAAVSQGVGLASTSVNTNLAGGRLIMQPLTPSNELFPFNMTATRVDLNFSGAFTAGSTTNASAAFTSTFFLGFYTRVNSTQLSLLNSGSVSYALAADVANSSRLAGARYLSFDSSLFSNPPSFSAGGQYWFGQLIRTSGAIYTGAGAVISQYGMFLGQTNQRSGQMGVAAASNTSSNAWYPFMGVHSLTTHTSMPGSMGNGDLNKVSLNANFIPHVLLNAGVAPID